MKLTIIGGTSGFGKRLAENVKEFFSDLKIQITGRNEIEGKKIAQSLGVIFSTNNKEAVKDSDIVIVSVPIGVTTKVIDEIGPYLKEGAVLADVTSVKTEPYKTMLKYSNTALIIPSHPMFGPYIKNLAGQVIIFTPPENAKKNKKYIWLKNFLKKQGVKVFEISPEEHDKIMSIVQGLTHFSLFVVGETLKTLLQKNFGHKEDIFNFLENFTSPVYKMLTSLVGRYMGQNPQLYADIQINNKINKIVQQTFINTANKFHELLFKTENINGFINTLKEGKEFFGEYAGLGQKYTDKIVFLLSLQIEKIKNNVGNTVKIQNIYSKQVVDGNLEEFDFKEMKIDGKNYSINEWIMIENGEVRI